MKILLQIQQNSGFYIFFCIFSRGDNMEKVQHIFQNISKAEWSRMMVCFHASEKWYKTGERVCSYDENNEQIVIVMEGTVQLVITHTDGRQTILEQLEPGSLFGEPLSNTAFSGRSLQVYS